MKRGAASTDGLRRGIRGATWLHVILLVWVLWVVSVAAFAVLVTPLALFMSYSLALKLAIFGWPLLGALLFVRPVERAISRPLFRLRPPTDIEMQTLWPAWEQVCARAGVAPDKYLLRIQDSDILNACAASAHLVAVTRGSLLHLSAAELEAVLAHEIGHHLDLHSVAGMLYFWLRLPVQAAQVVVGSVARALGGLQPIFGVAGILLTPVILALAFLGVLVAIPIALAEAASKAFGRRAEYAADRYAVKLGYGPHMSSVLQLFIDMGHDDLRAQQSLSARLSLSHPPLHKRVQAMEKFAARSSSTPDTPGAPATGVPGILGTAG